MKIIRQYVYLNGDLLGRQLTYQEIANLTADELRDAIRNYEVDVVQTPDGGHTLYDYQADNYSLVDCEEEEETPFEESLAPKMFDRS